MDFTNLQLSKDPPCRFTQDNKQLRKHFYILFANTKSLQEVFTNVRYQFQKYIDTNLLQLKYDDDIINSFLVALELDESKNEQIRKELEVEIKVRPLFASIKIAPKLKITNQVVQNMDKIGYQHIAFLLKDNSESSSSTSETDFGSGDEIPVAKKLKTCQKAIKVDSMLQRHIFNNDVITGTAVHVDILIYMKGPYCKELSKYLGLIYIEELLEEVEGKPFEDLLFRLGNKNAKLYRLIQSSINKKLITGCNNICLINNLVLWENINANVRAFIVNNRDDLDNMDVGIESNFIIILGEEPSFLSYIEAISIIIDEALSCKCHVIAKYDCGQNLYSKVKLSLASIVPLYVLRYFSQCKIVDCKHELL